MKYINLVRRENDRKALLAYEASGRVVCIRKKRNTDIRVSLNGFPDTTVQAAVDKITSFLTGAKTNV